MKTLRILLLLLLTLSMTITSLTSCEMIAELGIELPDILGKEEPQKEPTPDEKVDPATCGHYVTTTKNAKAATCTTEGNTGDSVCIVCGTVVTPGKAIATTKHSFKDGKCTVCGADAPVSDFEAQIEAWKAEYSTITIAEALTLCEQFVESPSADRYYIIATITSVDNPTYGQFTVEDETGSIMVYGTYSNDGALKYSEMGVNLKEGDLILIHGTLQNFKGNTKEVQNARLIDYAECEDTTPEINPDDYTLSSITDARLLADGTIVKVQGVVARITFATGKVPSGFYLVDGTSSIYVYDSAIAGRVSIGNTVTLVGAKDHWILADEQNNANKFGYQGCNQITNCTLVSNDNGNTAFDTSWIPETTVKSIMDTPVTEDITTLTYKVTALIRKVPGSGFVNYYIDDLDGVTGTYVYTQCNGSDFAWLDAFDGKICTVYLSALNAKSTATGCNWRFIPVAVIDEGFTFSTSDIPAFVVKYHGVTSVQNSYMIGASVELPTTVDSTILDFTGASLSYTVSDNTVADMVMENGKLTFVTLKAGTVQLTVTGSYTGVESYSETITITVSEANTNIEALTVAEAIASATGTEITIKGIVGPSVVSIKAGAFYLIDETGAIVVQGLNAAEFMAGLKIGHEVVVKGTRTVTKDGAGQIVVENCTVVANYYGEHEYSTASFIKDASMSDIKAVADTADATAQVYVITATVEKTSNQQGSYTNVTFNVGGILLYTSSAAQYAWVEEFFAEGETSTVLTIELALCDWNAKGLKGAILAVYNADGSKTYNTANFES